MASQPEDFMGTAPMRKRPDLAALYDQLAKVSEQPPDYTRVSEVSRNNQAAAESDFEKGLIMSTIGGRHMAPAGNALFANALARRKPMRLNEADVAYQDSSTGEFVDAPGNTQRRREKVLTTQITAGERAALAEEARLARIEAERIRLAENKVRDDANRELRRDLGTQGFDLRRELAAGRRSDAAAARELKANTLNPAAQKEQADFAQQLGATDLALEAAKAYPSAFGKLRGIPGGVAGQFGESVMGTLNSDEETAARSQVFNVMSSVIKQRAGTAQSAHELRILNGFMPSPYDNADQITAKMSGYKRYLEGQKESHLRSVTSPGGAEGAPTARLGTQRIRGANEPAPAGASVPRRVYNPKTGQLEGG